MAPPIVESDTHLKQWVKDHYMRRIAKSYLKGNIGSYTLLWNIIKGWIAYITIGMITQSDWFMYGVLGTLTLLFLITLPSQTRDLKHFLGLKLRIWEETQELKDAKASVKVRTTKRGNEVVFETIVVGDDV